MNKENRELYKKLEELDLLYKFDVNLKPQAPKMLMVIAGFYFLLSLPTIFFSLEIFVGVMLLSVFLSFIALMLYVTENPHRAQRRKERLYTEAYQDRYGNMEPKLMIPQ